MDLGFMGQTAQEEAGASSKLVQQLQNAHFLFQKGVCITGLRQALGAKLWYSDRILDQYWNYATDLHVPKGDEDRLVREVESFYNIRQSKPAFYFTPDSQPLGFDEFLKKHGYTPAYEDSWLLLDSMPKGKDPKGWEVRLITRENKNDQEAWLKIFSEAYGGPAQAGEPYGSLSPAYVDVMRESFYKAFSGRTEENYLFCIGGIPVAIGTVCYNAKLAGIYSIGVPPSERKKGHGSAATLWLARRAFAQKAESVFCITETGSFVQKMYEKLGFREVFRGQALAKG